MRPEFTPRFCEECRRFYCADDLLASTFHAIPRHADLIRQLCPNDRRRQKVERPARVSRRS